MRAESDAIEAMRRLSIRSGATHIDVALSATMRVGSLLPAIVDALEARGDVDEADVAVRYELVAPGGAVLDTSMTLHELGIRHGTSLTLTRSSMDFRPPPSDDVAEVIGAAVAAVEQPWTGPRARLAGTLVAMCIVTLGAAVLLHTAFERDGPHRAGCVGVAAATGLLALFAATVAGRINGERDAGLILGLVAVGFSAVTGILAVPGAPGAPHALLAAAAAATSAVTVRVIACRAVIFMALACFAATIAVAALVCVLSAAPLVAIDAGLATASLAMIEAAPWLSLRIARLSAGTPENALPAHTWLTCLIAAFSASATWGAFGVVSRITSGTAIFAVTVGSVMMLRARTHHDVRRSAPLLVCGAVILGVALTAAAAAWWKQVWPGAALSMALGFLALYVGFTGAANKVSVVGRRTLELVEYAAFATVIPLTLWLSGVFGAVRGADLS